MIQDHIEIILYVTGAVTGSMWLQFLAPQAILRSFNGLEVSDPLALFFARVSGLVIGLLGVLLIWAGINPALRVPVVTICMLGKAVFVATALSRFGDRDFARGHLLTVIFDSVCVLLYLAFLLGF